ncbi:MAG: acetyl-CoA carboxylase biotin carboxyl carrier protein [Lachnospiraceae bacterium]
MNFQLEEILTVIDRVKEADLALFEYQDADARIKIQGKQETGGIPAEEWTQGSRNGKISEEEWTQGSRNGRISEEKLSQSSKGARMPEEELPQGSKGARISEERTQAGEAKEKAAGIYTQESPMVGTFYTAPSVDAEPFVKVGDVVKEGQTIGIVEAMKLMNEVNAGCSGIVEAIVAENEQMVEYGQPLIKIRREQE